jgi:hypothetical protein
MNTCFKDDFLVCEIKDDPYFSPYEIRKMIQSLLPKAVKGVKNIL